MKNEPLTKEKEIDTTAYNQNDFRRNPGFLSSDVRSAVELLEEKLHGYHKEPFNSIWDGVLNIYEKDVLKLIYDCFPVFKEVS